MPVIFIHGVNVRKDDNYYKDLAARDKLLRYLVLEPLAAKRNYFKQIEIANPYWGKYGVTFRWDQESLPKVDMLEHLGPANVKTPKSDLELVTTVKELADMHEDDLSSLERLGANQGILKRAATKDLMRFIEAVLSPIILSEMDLRVEKEDSPDIVGSREALLAVASQKVATDPQIMNAITAASTDQAVMTLLKESIQTHFQQLLISNNLASPQDVRPVDEGFEPLGPTSSRLTKLQWRIGELFNRAQEAPGRIATLPALELFREGLHSNVSQFLGDVFVYLNKRGSKTRPGLIVLTVLDAIRMTPKHHDDEPLIVITHSMGGNILYDILTYYAPHLRIDIWISVASQVGQFEEMKLFKASKEDIGRPNKVKGLKSKSQVGYWLNIYDPADALSFRAVPIFEDVDEEGEYLTGASAFKSHGAYFKRASFYQVLRDHIERAPL